MKGVLLAGGRGTRLLPLTKLTNKHLLPIFDKQMVYYPLLTLRKAGIREVLILTTPQHLKDFKKLLGDGKELKMKLSYKIQKEASGIAHALALSKSFVGKDNLALILGDNIFEENFSAAFKSFKSGGRIFLKAVKDPQRFGVATLAGKKVVEIIEKPKNPKTNLAVVGLYLYDARVFDIVKNLKPSQRGELEITDVNNWFVKAGEIDSRNVKGKWMDAGTFESLVSASEYVSKNPNRFAL
ncbi:MAG: sugar phosphate nucleotidyltransferase [Candidatus Gracilibacteria bacterium]|jgi:glucose-1-phosphate thymidylyltransferase